MHAHLQPTLRNFTAAVLLLLPLEGAAEAQSDRDTANRLVKLEQELQRLQRQIPRGANAPADAATEPERDNNSEMTVRILALERVVEQLTGQIEETRFQSERSARQLQVLQDDISLRLARIEQSLGLSGATAQQQSQLVAPSAGAGNQEASVAVVPTTPPPLEASPRPPAVPSSAFALGAPLSQPMIAQPTIQQPAPRPLVPLTAAPAPAVGAGAAVAANGGFVIRTDAAGRPLPPDPNARQIRPPAAPEPLPQQAAPRAAPGLGPVTSNQVAAVPAGLAVALPDGTPKQQYEFAFEFLKRQDYPKAEATLRDFLKLHPKDALAGNAQYWLGETYYVRGDFQQAAVEFMAGYQKYPKTNKGPDNLLKLGMSMAKLNQTQGACTALGRLTKDYPDAPDTVLKSAGSERTKLKCK